MPQVLEISRSDLAGAKDTGNREYLETAFKKAEETLKAGGTVHLMQVYSDAHREISEVIDSMEQLEHWKSIFIR